MFVTLVKPCANKVSLALPAATLPPMAVRRIPGRKTGSSNRWTLIIAAVASVLLVTLAVLQYRWTGELSAAANERMRANLEESSRLLANDHRRASGSTPCLVPAHFGSGRSPQDPGRRSRAVRGAACACRPGLARERRLPGPPGPDLDRGHRSSRRNELCLPARRGRRPVPARPGTRRPGRADSPLAAATPPATRGSDGSTGDSGPQPDAGGRPAPPATLIVASLEFFGPRTRDAARADRTPLRRGVSRRGAALSGLGDRRVRPRAAPGLSRSGRRSRTRVHHPIRGSGHRVPDPADAAVLRTPGRPRQAGFPTDRP